MILIPNYFQYVMDFFLAELYNMVGRPNIFSNAELKLATENFGSQNILGEGGYGPVYKVGYFP